MCVLINLTDDDNDCDRKSKNRLLIIEHACFGGLIRIPGCLLRRRVNLLWFFLLRLLALRTSKDSSYSARSNTSCVFPSFFICQKRLKKCLKHSGRIWIAFYVSNYWQPSTAISNVDWAAHSSSHSSQH